MKNISYNAQLNSQIGKFNADSDQNAQKLARSLKSSDSAEDKEWMPRKIVPQRPPYDSHPSPSLPLSGLKPSLVTVIALLAALPGDAFAAPAGRRSGSRASPSNTIQAFSNNTRSSMQPRLNNAQSGMLIIGKVPSPSPSFARPKRHLSSQANPPSRLTIDVDSEAIRTDFVTYINDLSGPLHHLKSTLFAEHVNEFSQPLNAVKSSLRNYLKKLELSDPDHANKKLFLEDPSLDMLLDKLEGMDRLEKCQTLARAIVSEVDFRTPFEGHAEGVSHNGYTFRGLDQKDMRSAKRSAYMFVNAKVGRHFGIKRSYAHALTGLILPSMAPELSHLHGTDRGIANMKYGSAEWLGYRAGIKSVLFQGKNPEDYTVAALDEIGFHAMQKQVESEGNTSAEDEYAIPFTAGQMFLELADARGEIDLANSDPTETTALEKQYVEIFRSLLKHERDERNAETELNKEPLLLRREDVAADELRKRGLDPDSKSSATNIVIPPGIGTARYPTELKPLKKLWMEKEGWFSLRFDPPEIKALPDLNSIYESRTVEHERKIKGLIARHVETLLDGMKARNGVTDATISVLRGGMGFEEEYMSANGLAVGSMTHARWASKKSDRIVFFEMKYSTEGKDLTKYFTYNIFQRGNEFQELPGDETPETWSIKNMEAVIGSEGDSLAKDPRVSQLTGETTTVASLSSTHEAGKETARLIVEEYFAPLKRDAYGKTSAEKESEMWRSIGILGYSAYLSFKEGKYLLGAAEVILEIPVRIPLPIIVRAVKQTGKLGGKLLIKAMAVAGKTGVQTGKVAGNAAKTSHAFKMTAESIRRVSAASKVRTASIAEGLSEIRHMLERNGWLKSLIHKPAGNCVAALEPVISKLRDAGYSTKVRAMYMWPNAGIDAPKSHFIVLAEKSGKRYAVDLTAGQFGEFRMLDAIIDTEEAWAKTYKAAAERTLIKYKDFNSAVAATSEFNVYRRLEPTDTIADATVLSKPAWYKH